MSVELVSNYSFCSYGQLERLLPFQPAILMNMRVQAGMIVRTCVPGMVLSVVLSSPRLMDGADSSSTNTPVRTCALSDPSLVRTSDAMLESHRTCRISNPWKCFSSFWISAQ